MSRTYPEAHIALKNNIRAALLKRAPDYGRSVWEEDLAEEIQVHPNTIRNAIRAKALLNAAAIWCLCEKFAGFGAEIYGTPLATDSQAQAVIEAVEEVLADARRELDGDASGADRGEDRMSRTR